mgnify:CR=1 FL=1
MLHRVKRLAECLRLIIGFGLVALLLSGLLARPVTAAGLLIADGGFGGVLAIESHEVDVTINNGIAVTRVTQVFRNTENRQVEAMYTFPVPRGASVANFSMWIGGKEVIGEVLEKQRARKIYNSYKKTRRDPGLLEQADHKSFEMRIFPIGPGAAQKVQITYYQELGIDHDWGTYVYPLATVTRPGIDQQVQGTFAFHLRARSAIPVTAAESPSHGPDVEIVRHTDGYFEASLETRGGSLARDVVVAYRINRPHTGIDLITSRRNHEDGYFTLMLTAGEDIKNMATGMDYLFILDISGSMGFDAKLPTSRASVSAFLNELGPEDRFELLTFNVRPHTLFNTLKPATDAALEKARRHLDTRQAKGGTALTPAIQTAYKYTDPDRPLNVVVLSDGLTEQAERRELADLIRSRPASVRVFCIGVGNEVNRPLLERIAEDAGGLAAFISRGDNFKRQARAFRRKLMRPVAANLTLTIDGVEAYDMVPAVLPNLFHGSPIRLYGRYKGAGPATVTLQGDVAGKPFSRDITLDFPAEDPANPEIERMWAWHRVDRLLKKADRSGDRSPVIDEVVRLGEMYSIVTEYTSFLVLENDAEYQRWKIDRRNALRTDRDRKAQSALRTRLDAIRDKALSGLGPEAAARPQPVDQKPASGAPDPAQARPQTPSRITDNQNQSRDLNFGTGPVGPILIGLACLINRRRSGR